MLSSSFWLPRKEACREKLSDRRDTSSARSVGGTELIQKVPPRNWATSQFGAHRRKQDACLLSFSFRLPQTEMLTWGVSILSELNKVSGGSPVHWLTQASNRHLCWSNSSGKNLVPDGVLTIHICTAWSSSNQIHVMEGAFSLISATLRKKTKSSQNEAGIEPES